MIAGYDTTLKVNAILIQTEKIVPPSRSDNIQMEQVGGKRRYEVETKIRFCCEWYDPISNFFFFNFHFFIFFQKQDTTLQITIEHNIFLKQNIIRQHRLNKTVCKSTLRQFLIYNNYYKLGRQINVNSLEQFDFFFKYESSLIALSTT